MKNIYQGRNNFQLGVTKRYWDINAILPFNVFANIVIMRGRMNQVLAPLYSRIENIAEWKTRQ